MVRVLCVSRSSEIRASRCCMGKTAERDDDDNDGHGDAVVRILCLRNLLLAKFFEVVAAAEKA